MAPPFLLVFFRLALPYEGARFFLRILKLQERSVKASFPLPLAGRLKRLAAGLNLFLLEYPPFFPCGGYAPQPFL